MIKRNKPKLKSELDNKIDKVKKHLEDIDKTIQNIVKELVEKIIDDKSMIDSIYIKTFYENMSYSILLYSNISNNIIGKKYTVYNLLKICSGNEDVVYELNKIIRVMLSKLNQKNLNIDSENIHWI